MLVTLNNLGPLDLLFLTPTQIVANLSALVPLAPGNYRLTVTNLKNGGGGKKRKRRSRSGAKHDDFELAVGAQGPSGADGADGADGATGPPGTAALVGLQCPPGEALVGFSADLVGNVVLDCTPFPAAPLSAFKVLVTSSAHTVNLGGLAGADASCQGLADAAGLDGTFTAWLSDSTTDARDRLPTNASWSLVGSGALVASDLADLTKGSINAPINEDETGSGTFGPDTKCGGSCPFVLTGTLPDGTGDDFSTAGDRFCNDWTAPLPGGDGHRQVTGYRTLDGNGGHRARWLDTIHQPRDYNTRTQLQRDRAKPERRGASPLLLPDGPGGQWHSFASCWNGRPSGARRKWLHFLRLA